LAPQRDACPTVANAKKYSTPEGCYGMSVITMRNTKRYISIFFLAVGILCVYKVLFDFGSLAGWFNRVTGILSPFIFGFVIAYCTNIPVAWLEKRIRKVKHPKIKPLRKFARGISIILTYTTMILIAVFGLRGFIPMIYENAMQLMRLMPEYIERGLSFLKEHPYAADLGLDEMISPLMEMKPWTNIDLNVLSSLRLAQNFFSGIFAVILTIISSIYFLVGYNKVKAFFHRLIGIISADETRRATLKYVRLVDTSFRKFLSCQFLDSLILGTITTIQFLILGSPYAFVLGLMLAVANIIPYFGSIFGSILAVFITVFSNGWETALLTAVVLMITQQFDGYFINPKIMGSSFKVSPILVIIAITVGGAIGGVPGMVFAIPVVNVCKTILEEFIQTREKLRNGIPIDSPEKPIVQNGTEP
jgi:predicted PurR-regulated permease PerM